MRIGAFIFLFGILANVVTIAGDITAHNYQRLPASNQIKAQNPSPILAPDQGGSILMKSFRQFRPNKTAIWFSPDLATRFILAQDTSSPADQSDSSDDQRGSGRIDASVSFSQILPN